MKARKYRDTFAPALLTAMVAAAPGQSQSAPPLSAIDWLSDSITVPDAAPPDTPAPQASSTPQTITVAPLDAPVPDRAGLISARALGLDPALWGNSAAFDLARLISNMPDTEPPALSRFLRNLLVTQFDPPVDALQDDSLYLARIDKLLDLGHLDDARALIAAAGAPEPRRFRRQFDIALLTGTETESCKVIEETPDISPTFPARIFCLARNGEWEVAALTLGTAEALDILSLEEDQLLLHFLDPDLFEGEALPPVPLKPSPLIFRLYEAVGERLSTDRLPVAFAAADLTDTVGWKARLRAAERLAAAGALSPERMMAIFGERSPAASGGIWERVRALQTVRAALQTEDAAEIAVALPPAWAAARLSGVEATLAPWLAARLANVELSGAAAHVAFEISLLAGNVDLAKRFASPRREDQFLLAVAEGNKTNVPPGDMLGQAIRRGLSAYGPGDRFRDFLQDGRPGEALLMAIAMVSEGSAGDPDAVADALRLFRAIGLEALARQVAVELLLLEGAA